MSAVISGLHHVTAIAGDPQRNYDFYCGLLGLRLVKRTVNFDDPGTYHFYFGDAVGRPGTIMTFFPWPGAQRGRRGSGEATVTSFAVPPGSLGFWQTYLQEHGVQIAGHMKRFDVDVLSFDDPDGMALEMIEAPAAVDPSDVEIKTAGWKSPIPAELAITGFHSVTLSVAALEPTASMLTETMGLHTVAEEGARFRYAAGSGSAGTLVDVVCGPELQPGRIGAGIVHHIAWRTPDDAQQREWRQTLSGLGYSVSPVMDRDYFHSIYFREPGGVLFEIATDPPGFTADEALASLGNALKLPAWLEPQREIIETKLPELNVRSGEREAQG